MARVRGAPLARPWGALGLAIGMPSHNSRLITYYGIHLGRRPDEHTMHATLAVPSHVTHPANPPQSGQLTSPQPAQ